MVIGIDKFQFVGVILSVKTGIKNRYNFTLKVGIKYKSYATKSDVFNAETRTFLTKMHRNERFLQDFYKNFELLRAK